MKRIKVLSPPILFRSQCHFASRTTRESHAKEADHLGGGGRVLIKPPLWKIDHVRGLLTTRPLLILPHLEGCGLLETPTVLSTTNHVLGSASTTALVISRTPSDWEMLSQGANQCS